uniref:Paired-like class homeodomain transcription factor Micro1/Pmar1 related n=1 Tax=Scaphechinus mirabilis TaxID=262334 RepID=E3WF03_SCAMI|nr:paired-like class homeodomain transcription factor Micro1/Pmar1 related [Scaphechinus mirabilis]
MADSIVSARAPSTRKRPARRLPTVFTEWQLQKHEAEFNTDQYPDVNVRERLATSLQLMEDRIQVWFQNRRARHRRATLKKTSTASPTSDERVDDQGLPSVNTRKRKSPCDVTDAENTPPPCKKLAVVSSSMSVDFLSRSSRSSDSSSSPYRRWMDDVIGLQRTTPHDTHRGATSPLMSGDFLSRSSRSPSPSTSWLSARPVISPALTTRISPSSYYAWPGHPYIYMLPY